MATTTRPTHTTCANCRHTVSTTDAHNCPGLPHWAIGPQEAFTPGDRSEHKLLWSTDARTCDRCSTYISPGNVFLGQINPVNGRLECAGCMNCAQLLGMAIHTLEPDKADLVWLYHPPLEAASPRTIAETILEAYEQEPVDISATDGYAEFDLLIHGHIYRVHIQKRA
jgi:hypothetical protein